MAKEQSNPESAVLVAIDIAKIRNEVLIEAPGRPRRRRLTVLNTRAEHDRLIGELEGLSQPIVVGFEATGNYHRPLAWRLLEAGFGVCLISSVALARMVRHATFDHKLAQAEENIVGSQPPAPPARKRASARAWERAAVWNAPEKVVTATVFAVQICVARHALHLLRVTPGVTPAQG